MFAADCFLAHMNRLVLLFVLGLSFQTALAQDFLPVPILGFNHDVVAEGGNSSLVTTTLEMDAITPSNNVLCTRNFANEIDFTPPDVYGLPDDGTLSTAGRSYQLAPYDGPNALYLFAGDSGTLTLPDPTRFTDLTLLGLSTEGQSQVRFTFHFSDGTKQNDVQNIQDWFSGAVPNTFSGYGRVKRKNGPFVNGVDYEAALSGNPRISTLDFALPCTKTLTRIGIRNISAGVGGSFRALIFAVSGKEKKIIPIVSITASDTSICAGKPVTFQVQSSNAGASPQYQWRLNNVVVLTNQPTYTHSGLQNQDVVKCILETNEVCAFPDSLPSNSIRITVKPIKIPRVRIEGGDSTVCQGSPISFQADAQGSGAIRYQWLKNGQPVGLDSARYSISTGNPGDTIRCLVISLEECRSRDSVISNLKKLKILPVFDISIQAPDTVYLDETPVILAGSPASGIFSGVGVTDSLFRPEIAGLGRHLYQYAFPGNVCVDPLIKSIVVRERILPCTIGPATLLTPNGDGHNDNWFVGEFNDQCLSSARVQVFDRWGKEAFSSDDYRNTWSAENLNTGVYYFLVEYSVQPRSGSGNLTRTGWLLIEK